MTPWSLAASASPSAGASDAADLAGLAAGFRLFFKAG
jgi:hypothetical protein